MHAVDATRRERDEVAADELRPADHEDRVGAERVDGLDRLRRIDVGRLDKGSAHVVERALAGAVRVDRPRQGDDADDLGPGLASREQAVATDRVEADPDGAHGRRFYGGRPRGLV